MNVLFVANDDHHFGSAQALMELVHILQQKHEVVPTVLTQTYGDVNHWCSKHNVCNYVFPYKPCVFFDDAKGYKFVLKFWIRWLRNLFLNELAYWRAKKHINFNEIDLIHTNSSDLDFGIMLAKRTKVKHVCHVREFCDHDCWCYRKKRLEYLANNSVAMIAISRSLFEFCLRQNVQKNKLYQVYDGMDFSDIVLRSEKKSDVLRCIMVGNISQGKGQRHVVRVMSSLPDHIRRKTFLDIVGSGSPQEEQYIKDLIKQLDLSDNVRLCGISSSVHTLLSDYDVGIIASFSEGFGRVTVEFMAAGLLVIASDTGATTELIQNEKAGMLYAYSDWKTLGIKIMQVCQTYEATYKMRQEAIQFVRNNFDANKNANGIFAIYQQCLQICEVGVESQ